MPATATSNRNLRLLVSGQFVSAVGDQFFLIALPWLALQISGSGLVAGTLLAVAGIPRALLMLLGGAASDRYSAKSLLIASNGSQAALMTILGAALLLSFDPLWFLYALAFLTGTVDAFGLPAINAMLPILVAEEDLESGNLYLQGANMVSGVIGPVLAAGLIAWASAGGGPEGTLTGIGLAFLLNALTFVAGIGLFWRIPRRRAGSATDRRQAHLVQSIPEVFQFVRGDLQLRRLLPLLFLLGLFLTGTIRIGFPMLAAGELGGSILTLGGMTSVFGAGVLFGMIGVRLLPKPAKETAGLFVLGLLTLLPIGLVTLALYRSQYMVLGAALAMGLAVGYVMIYLLSWLQRRTPSELLGRMMALGLFAIIGMSPLSQVLMGWLLEIRLQASLLAVGLLLLLVLVFTALQPEMWALGEE